MRTTRILSALFILLLLSSFAADWMVLEKKDKGFKISFPRKPEESEQSLTTAIGPMMMHMWLCDQSKYKDDNGVYGIIYSDYPDTLVSSDFKDELIDSLFSNTISGSVSSMQGELLSTTVTPYKTYPGRQVKVKFADGQGIMNMKLYLIKSRMYIMEVGCEKDKDNNPYIDKFFNSFSTIK